jgi:hypothetical protein
MKKELKQIRRARILLGGNSTPAVLAHFLGTGGRGGRAAKDLDLIDQLGRIALQATCDRSIISHRNSYI